MKNLRDSKKHWTEIKNDLVYKGEFLNTWRNQIESVKGDKETYEVVERPDSVIILTSVNMKIILVKVQRYPTNEVSWEFPCGGIDAGESPYQAAIREFVEETALVNIKPQQIGIFYPSPGLTRQRCYVFLANMENLNKVSAEQESQGRIAEFELTYRTTREIHTMIKSGEITDGFTLGAFSIFLSYLKSKRH